MTIKPGNQITGKARMIGADELPTLTFPTSGRVYVGKHQRKPTIWNAWFQQ
jgi:hypothetical protein